MRAPLPVAGGLLPSSYAGSLLDTPTRFSEAVLELWDAMDPADARAWWRARLTLAAQDPPLPDASRPDGPGRDLLPVLPAAPGFLADALLAHETDVDVVLAAGGFGVPLTARQLSRLTNLVAGDRPTQHDDELLELLAPTGLLRSP